MKFLVVFLHFCMLLLLKSNKTKWLVVGTNSLIQTIDLKTRQTVFKLFFMLAHQILRHRFPNFMISLVHLCFIYYTSVFLCCSLQGVTVASANTAGTWRSSAAQAFPSSVVWANNASSLCCQLQPPVCSANNISTVKKRAPISSTSVRSALKSIMCNAFG